MRKGITINNKHSYNDFKLEIGTRTISPPKQKRITETVPYMHGCYDFSSINDEVALENRLLKYEFDISETSTEKMENIKSKVLSWLYQTNETIIEDDYIKNYYFIGSLESIDWGEDFGKGTMSVVFSVYPFMISKTQIEKTYNVNDILDTTIENKSSHIIVPKIITDGSITIEINNKTYTLSEGEWEDSDLYLISGINEIRISGNSNVSIIYREEVI